MKNRCNFKLVFGIILSALIFVSCTDDEIVSNDKLELNKVLNFSYKTEIKSKNQLVATLTVPENKVWKIETTTLYFDEDSRFDGYSNGLLLNQFVIYKENSYGNFQSNSYLISGDYKLIINSSGPEIYDYGYTTLSVLEYNVK